jgi:hypothetical protein
MDGIAMTQLPLHNIKWGSFFEKLTCCGVAECVGASVADAQFVL